MREACAQFSGDVARAVSEQLESIRVLTRRCFNVSVVN